MVIFSEEEIGLIIAIVKELSDEEVKSFKTDEARAVIYKIHSIGEGEPISIMHPNGKRGR